MDNSDDKLINELYRQTKLALENSDVYQLSKKTKVKAVFGKADEREETVVDSEELYCQQVKGFVDTSRLKTISSIIKEIDEIKRRGKAENDGGRINEMLESLKKIREGR